MKFLIISDAESSGGAAIATSNLSLALTNQSCEIIRVVLFTGDAQQTLRFWPINTLWQRFGFKVLRLSPNWVRQKWADRRLKKLIDLVKPDVINFHNILWGASLGWHLGLYKVAARKVPTLITMHDLWNAKGYPYEANRAVGKSYSGEKRLRHKVFSQNRLHFISPSQWLKEQFLKEFPRLVERTHLIPYGVNTLIYKPITKNSSRAKLGITSSKRVVLASAASLAYANKGFSLLLQALHQRKNDDLLLVVMGDVSELTSTQFPSDLEVKTFGFVQDEEVKAEVYSSADFMTFPSLEDNLPNSVLECLACGTPVVAFPIGGLPDMVLPQQTGWLATEVSASGLLVCMEKALDDIRKGVSFMGECRSLILNNFNLELQAKKYISLTESLCEQ